MVVGGGIALVLGCARPLRLERNEPANRLLGHNYMVRACIVMAYIAMAYTVLANTAMAYIVMSNRLLGGRVEGCRAVWRQGILPESPYSIYRYGLYHILKIVMACTIYYI